MQPITARVQTPQKDEGPPAPTGGPSNPSFVRNQQADASGAPRRVQALWWSGTCDTSVRALHTMIRCFWTVLDTLDTSNQPMGR
jgi:hypothetical protein